jgi:aminopeptidase-like protein
LIIDTVYSGIIKVKLDQNSQKIYVLDHSSRDIGIELIDDLVFKFQNTMDSIDILESYAKNSSGYILKQKESDKLEKELLQKNVDDAKSCIKVIE